MSTRPKKFKTTTVLELMPNGYRLATVEEVEEDFEAIKRRGLLEVRLEEWGGWDEGRLLNGRIRAGYRLEHSFGECHWGVVVKEMEADGRKKKCSACYPPNGNLLRAQLYDGIRLSEQDRKIALSLASINADAQVICWLLKTTNAMEFQAFQNLFRLPVMERYKYIPLYRMVEYLCASKFPLQLPLEQDNQHETALDYLIGFIDNWVELGMRVHISYIDLLIEVYSADIVHCKIGVGISFLDKATSEAIHDKKWIEILTKLLSVSLRSVENQVPKIKDCFGDVLIKAVERGYTQLIDVLLKFKDSIDQLATDVCLEVARGAIRKSYTKCLQNMLNSLKNKVGSEVQQDKYGKTFFHYAAKSENEEISQMIGEAYKEWYRVDSVNKRDKWGRTFLHWAALTGQADMSKVCIDEWKLKVDARDKLGQNSLHLAAKGIRGDLVVDILLDSSSVDLIYATDGEGRTPLHLASAKGNIKMVEKLLGRSVQQPQGLEKSAINRSQVKKLLEQTDGSGKTALQMAAQGGHTRIVQRLLKEDIDPLLLRDVHGSTALHCATGVKDSDVALAISKSLLNKYERDDKRSLMLWASAVGIGTAEEREEASPLVKDFLLKEKARDDNNLLKAAALTDNVDMAWELLHRGADIADIKPSNKPRKTEKDEKFIRVIKEIQVANEQGQDKPSSEDNLGRNVLAEGLAALFLNKFVESPITVGVCGEWGMGKSSVMIQTENFLLMAASQLSFPYVLPFENFVGAKKMSLSTKGRKIYRRFKNAAYKLFPDNSSTMICRRMKNAVYNFLFFMVGLEYDLPWSKLKLSFQKNQLVQLLEDYHPKYHAIYKSLACMDVQDQVSFQESSVGDRENPFQAMRETPRILTIRYNAWHYRDENEAWAGLAFTITKEIEQVMTRAQKFSTCWRYSWAENGANICIQIFLPCLLAIFLAGWVAWGAWTLLSEAKFKYLKYGSIPFTIIAIVWRVLQSIISAVKPVSVQMMGYINSPDHTHTARLGYQQQVISDINFLKGELGRKPHWFFSFISGEWCWNWLGLYSDNVGNTCVPKVSPASEDQLRIIAFVDDLDRCDEKVIIQVLCAINLVLAECKINVILGIDKKMIQKAVEKHFEDKDKDLADKFICKIIQIPLSLPDLTLQESDKFLQHFLGQPPPSRVAIRVEEGEGTDYGEIDTDDDDIETSNKSPREESTSIDIFTSCGPQTCSKDTIKKVFNGLTCFFQKVFNRLTCFFQNLCLFACNLSNEFQQMQDVVNKKEIHPLTFSKGARLTREMLLSKYRPEEAKILYKLEEFVTGSQRLPREWKRFLDYYKFACNILSMIGKVYKLPSWRVELMAWTFICWQWKHEMNTLIKGWHKYANVKVEDEVKEDWLEPSLKQIVKNYVKGLHDQPKKSNNEVLLDKDDTTTVEESQDQFYNWLKLLEVLHDVQDVSMKGIQLFQQFRLHCEIDNLPWPLPEPSESLYERLMQ